MLTYRIEKDAFDALPEALQEHYTEKGDAFELQHDGLGPEIQKRKTVRDERDKLAERLEALEAQTAAMARNAGAESPAELAELLTKWQEQRRESETKTQRLERLAQERQEALEAQAKERDEIAGKYDELLTNRRQRLAREAVAVELVGLGVQGPFAKAAAPAFLADHAPTWDGDSFTIGDAGAGEAVKAWLENPEIKAVYAPPGVVTKTPGAPDGGAPGKPEGQQYAGWKVGNQDHRGGQE